MGFFDIFKRNKFNKIKREDVVEQIIKYSKELEEYENAIIVNKEEINALFTKGKKEKDLQVREMLAQKISRKKKEQGTILQKIKFLEYNINVLNNLKQAIDDQAFSKEKKNNPINKLLNNSKDLNDFLLKSHEGRQELESTLINATETFEEFESLSEENSEIYGTKTETSDIMAQFELDDNFDDELNIENEEKINKGKEMNNE